MVSAHTSAFPVDILMMGKEFLWPSSQTPMSLLLGEVLTPEREPSPGWLSFTPSEGLTEGGVSRDSLTCYEKEEAGETELTWKPCESAALRLTVPDLQLGNVQELAGSALFV